MKQLYQKSRNTFRLSHYNSFENNRERVFVSERYLRQKPLYVTSFDAKLMTFADSFETQR